MREHSIDVRAAKPNVEGFLFGLTKRDKKDSIRQATLHLG